MGQFLRTTSQNKQSLEGHRTEEDSYTKPIVFLTRVPKDPKTKLKLPIIITPET